MVFAPRSMALVASLGAAGVIAGPKVQWDANRETLKTTRQAAADYKELSVTAETNIDVKDQTVTVDCLKVLSPLWGKAPFKGAPSEEDAKDRESPYYKTITTLEDPSGSAAQQWLVNTESGAPFLAGGGEDAQVRVYGCVKKQAEDVKVALDTVSIDYIKKQVKFRVYAMLYFYFVTYTLKDNASKPEEAIFNPEGKGNIPDLETHLTKVADLTEKIEQPHFGAPTQLGAGLTDGTFKDKTLFDFLKDTKVITTTGAQAKSSLLEIYSALAIERGTKNNNYVEKAEEKKVVDTMASVWTAGDEFKKNVEAIVEWGFKLLAKRGDGVEVDVNATLSACHKESYNNQQADKATAAACHPELTSLMNTITNGDKDDPSGNASKGFWKAQEEMAKHDQLLYSHTKVLRILQASLGINPGNSSE